MKKKTVISILISAIALYIALRGVSFDGLVAALSSCNYLYLFPAAIVMYFLFLIRALRWYYLVKPIKEARFKNLFSATMIGFMANNIFPARAGEFVRANILGNDENISKSSVFATIVIERLFDGMSLLFILFATFLTVDLTARLSEDVALNLKRAAVGAFSLYLMVFICIIFLCFKYDLASKIILAIFKPFGEKVSEYAHKLLESFKTGLKIDKNPKSIILIIVYSLLHWIFCALPIYIVLKGFGYDLPLEAAFVVLIMKSFAVMVPAAPGYIGTLNVAVIYALSFYAVPERPEGVSISMVVWLVDFLPVVLLGFLLLWYKGISIKSIEKTAKIES